MLNKLKIEVIDRNPERVNTLACCRGRITIGNFKEEFNIPVDWWSLERYERQWKEAIERIKTKKQSCLVASYDKFKGQPSIILWVLYKRDNKIFIQNHYLLGKTYKKRVGKKQFTIQTCYRYVPPRKIKSALDGYKISEWVIDAE